MIVIEIHNDVQRKKDDKTQTPSKLGRYYIAYQISTRSRYQLDVYDVWHRLLPVVCVHDGYVLSMF